MKMLRIIPMIACGMLWCVSGSVWATATTTEESDYTRKELAAAIINYEAASRMQEYMKNKELLLMSAPASIWAIQAGAVIGASNTSSAALNISDKSLLNSLGALTKATTVKIRGVDYPVSKTGEGGPIQYYEKIKEFVQNGDVSGLGNVNIASLMQADNIKKTGASINEEQAQTLVNVLVDPFPSSDMALQTKIKNNQDLTGQDMEMLGNKVASYAIVGVSAMALGDIIARRIPSGNQSKSIMEVMDDMSQERIKSTDWYNDIGRASEPALLREIAHMMAYNQWIAYEQFRVTEQQLAVLASLNAVMAKVNVGIDQMNSQLEAARAQAASANVEMQQKMDELNTTPFQQPTTP